MRVMLAGLVLAVLAVVAVACDGPSGRICALVRESRLPTDPQAYELCESQCASTRAACVARPDPALGPGYCAPECAAGDAGAPCAPTRAGAPTTCVFNAAGIGRCFIACDPSGGGAPCPDGTRCVAGDAGQSVCVGVACD